MKLIIVRHGETVENKNHICQGQSPGTLSENGLKQVDQLGLRLKDENIAVMYSSDLKRTVDTSNAILKYHPELKLNLDIRVRERAFGEYEGTVIPDDFDWDNLPKGVESNQEMCMRVKEFVDEIYSKHKDKTVLVVSHGGTKLAFFTVIYDLPVSEFNKFAEHTVKNTSLSVFEIKEDNNHKMHVMGCTKHLG